MVHSRLARLYEDIAKQEMGVLWGIAVYAFYYLCRMVAETQVHV